MLETRYMRTYFVKSLEEDFCTKTLRGDKKVTFQKVEDMIRLKKILPNTKSFGRKQRLSTTILHENYLKTYRPSGIIFCTKAKPSYVLPCDLVLLTTADKIVTQYYRIKDNLHLYYNHSLIPGFEQFIFKDFDSLFKKYSSLGDVWKAIHKFRKQNNCPGLLLSKYRLIEYNEAVFERPISIEPVALFGRSKKGRGIAKKYGMPYYKTAKEFYKKQYP